MNRQVIAGLSGATMLIYMLGGTSDAMHVAQAAPTMSISEDGLNTRMKLNLSISNPRISLHTDGTLSQPLRFFIYSNYQQKITSYQIKVYDANDAGYSHVLGLITVHGVNPFTAIEWQGQLENGNAWKPDGKYIAILEVTGKNGKKDITSAIPFQIQETILPDAHLSESAVVDQEIVGYGTDKTNHRGIVSEANDAKIVIQLAGLVGAREVKLNNQPIVIDDNGRAVVEEILPAGEHNFTLTWLDAEGQQNSQSQTIAVKQGTERNFFYVAMADMTWSNGRVTGPGKDILLNVDPYHYSGSNIDGRLAFYTKGNLNSTYRLTAHLDTTEERLGDMFGHISHKDPRRFTKELNPYDYYPLYGDDSTTESDVNTEGRFYLKLEKGKDHLLWGNYNTQMTGTELVSFNRSLYGAQYYHESEDVTQYNQTKNYLNVFAATTNTRGSHNEFLSTGGSLYFLKHQRLTTGTLKLSVETRDQNTGRVKSVATLTPGTDYQVDDFQGRILLTKPLPMTSANDSILRGDHLLAGDQVWLIADYEYYSDGFDMSEQTSQGIRGYQWLGDHWRVGGSYVMVKEPDGQAYRLYGNDLIWRPAAGMSTRLEYARSTEAPSDIYNSDNGGLNFSQVTPSGHSHGRAWTIEQTVDLREHNNQPFKLGAYYSKKEQGFSSFAAARTNDLSEWGVAVDYAKAAQKQGWNLKYTVHDDLTRERIASLAYHQALTPTLTATLAVEDRRNTQQGSEDTREDLIGVKLEKELRGGKDKAYIIQQVTLNNQGTADNNDRTTIGYHYKPVPSFTVAAEAFDGHLGSGGALGVTWDANDRASVYTKVTNDIDASDGRGIRTIAGMNWKMDTQMELYTEKEFQSLTRESSTTDAYGVTYRPNKAVNVNISYNTGHVSRKTSDNTTLNGGSQTDRAVWTVDYGFTGQSLEARNKLEYRRESGTSDITQWVTTNRIKTKSTTGWSWLGQYDYAHTTGDSSVVNNFTEAAVGFAYRPVDNNRLNLFGKVSLLRGMNPQDQLVAATDAGGHTVYDSDLYEQRTFVYAAEGVYDLNRRWQIAFKAARRQGDLRYRGESEWYSAGATLYAGRVKYSPNRLWDYQVEYRTLRVDTAQDAKNGWVASLYRQLGPHAKVGVGYNWTTYNDDLTRLNYDAQGWFVSVVGKW